MKLRKIISKLNKNSILLIAIFLFGSWLRFYNLNWDDGYVFHPDELNIDIAVSNIRFFSQLNPHFFQYNGLPIYLYRLTGELLNYLKKTDIWTTNWANINLIGRFYSALVSSLTILLVYKLAIMLFKSQKTALLAAFFTSATVSLIQSAHFAVTESLLVFFLLLIALFTLRFMEKQTLKFIIPLAVASGMALAVKTTALSFLIIPFVAFIIIFFEKRTIKQFKIFLFHGLIFLLLSLISFFIFSPFNLLDWQSFKGGMLSERGIITGKARVPWNFQFLYTKPYLYQIKNLFWQLGPILPITSFFGFTLCFFWLVKQKNKQLAPIIVWTAVFFLSIGSLFVKYVRYFNPLLVLCAIFSSVFLVKAINKNKLVGRFLTFLSLVLTSFYALSFLSIYLKETSRITASKWIFQNLKADSKILTENDDHFSLPLYLRDYPTRTYQFSHLAAPYKTDDEQKLDEYSQSLTKADYLIIANRRLSHVISRLEKEFPYTSNYYQQLFTGQLGYQAVAEFSSYPSLLGFTLNDDQAEETFQVFDHPKVIILKNIDRKEAWQLKNIIKNNYHD